MSYEVGDQPVSAQAVDLLGGLPCWQVGLHAVRLQTL